MMWQNLFPATPLRRRGTSQCSITSLQNELDEKFQYDVPDGIPQLYNKFIRMSSKVEIDHDLSSFNLIEYDRSDKKIQFDQQMMSVKLKQLENNAELKRATTAIERSKKRRGPRTPPPEPILNEKDHYLNAFKTFKENVRASQEEDAESQQEKIQIPPPSQPQQGIVYYNQLSRHPKLLNYTLQKKKSRDAFVKQKLNSKAQKLEEFRKQMRELSLQQLPNNNKIHIQVEIQPEQVAGDIFRRIYTKKHKERSTSQARSNRRMSQFIQQQDEIFENVDKRSVSKENYKKLKERFNEIINQLYEVDRKKLEVKQRRNSSKNDKSTPHFQTARESICSRVK